MADFSIHKYAANRLLNADINKENPLDKAIKHDLTLWQSCLEKIKNFLNFGEKWTVEDSRSKFVKSFVTTVADAIDKGGNKWLVGKSFVEYRDADNECTYSFVKDDQGNYHIYACKDGIFNIKEELHVFDDIEIFKQQIDSSKGFCNGTFRQAKPSIFPEQSQRQLTGQKTHNSNEESNYLPSQNEINDFLNSPVLEDKDTLSNTPARDGKKSVGNINHSEPLATIDETHNEKRTVSTIENITSADVNTSKAIEQNDDAPESSGLGNNGISSNNSSILQVNDTNNETVENNNTQEQLSSANIVSAQNGDTLESSKLVTISSELLVPAVDEEMIPEQLVINNEQIIASTITSIVNTEENTSENIKQNINSSKNSELVTSNENQAAVEKLKRIVNELMQDAAESVKNVNTMVQSLNTMALSQHKMPKFQFEVAKSQFEVAKSEYEINAKAKYQLVMKEIETFMGDYEGKDIVQIKLIIHEARKAYDELSKLEKQNVPFLKSPVGKACELKINKINLIQRKASMNILREE